MNRRIMRWALIGCAYSISCLSHAQTSNSDGISGPLSCPEFKVTARVLSITRLEAGKLSMDVDYETAANMPLKRGTQGQQMKLVDDAGNQWEFIRSNALMQTGAIESGVRTKVTYKFQNIMQGADAKTVSLLHGVHVQAKNKTLGRCTFTAKNLPIS